MADRHEETRALISAAIELARCVGDRPWEVAIGSGSLTSLNLLGRWDEAIARADELRASSESEEGFSAFEIMVEIQIRVERGEIEFSRELLEASQHFETSEDVQVRAGYKVQAAAVSRGEGDNRAALARAHTALEAQTHLGWRHPIVKHAFVEATLAARALDDSDELAALVARVEVIAPGEVTPYLQAQATRAAAGIPGAPWEANLKRAAGLFRELNMSFWLAVTLLDHAERLVAHDRAQDAVSLLDEAASIFERLEAKPWLDRLEQVRSRRPEVLRASARAFS